MAPLPRDLAASSDGALHTREGEWEASQGIALGMHRENFPHAAAEVQQQAATAALHVVRDRLRWLGESLPSIARHLDAVEALAPGAESGVLPSLSFSPTSSVSIPALLPALSPPSRSCFRLMLPVYACGSSVAPCTGICRSFTQWHAHAIVKL